MARKVEMQSIGTPAVPQDRRDGRRITRDGSGTTCPGCYRHQLCRRDGAHGALPDAPARHAGLRGGGRDRRCRTGREGVRTGRPRRLFLRRGGLCRASLKPADLRQAAHDISNEVAATFLAKGLTAWMGLYALHRITAGEVILVLGASGSVGSILSRWARALGATVIGVAGTDQSSPKSRRARPPPRSSQATRSCPPRSARSRRPVSMWSMTLSGKRPFQWSLPPCAMAA